VHSERKARASSKTQVLGYEREGSLEGKVGRQKGKELPNRPLKKMSRTFFAKPAPLGNRSHYAEKKKGSNTGQFWRGERKYPECARRARPGTGKAKVMSGKPYSEGKDPRKRRKKA